MELDQRQKDKKSHFVHSCEVNAVQITVLSFLQLQLQTSCYTGFDLRMIEFYTRTSSNVQ